jgi:hypothetical protein
MKHEHRSGGKVGKAQHRHSARHFTVTTYIHAFDAHATLDLFIDSMSTESSVCNLNPHHFVRLFDEARLPCMTVKWAVGCCRLSSLLR